MRWLSRSTACTKPRSSIGARGTHWNKSNWPRLSGWIGGISVVCTVPSTTSHLLSTRPATITNTRLPRPRNSKPTSLHRTQGDSRHRFAEQRLDGLKDRPKCPPPRQYHADIQARLLVLACQKPAEVDPTRGGQTHWSIKDLAQYVAAHPELGLGHPSTSTIGVILKRHQVRLDRL
jgi:hypothetical protein